MLLVLIVGGCGRSGFDVVLPSTGTIQLVQLTSVDWQYERYQFCWRGELVTSDPDVESGAVATAATYPDVLPPSESQVVADESEDLRPGTWRLRYRLTGLTSGLPNVTLVDVQECVNYDGQPPRVMADARTIVVLRHDVPGQCNWSLQSQAVVPTMGTMVAHPCDPP
jgi:hypothetical protein